MNYEPWRLYGLQPLKPIFFHCPPPLYCPAYFDQESSGHRRNRLLRQCEHNRNGLTALNWICLPEWKRGTKVESLLANNSHLHRWQLPRKDAWDVAKDGRYRVGFMTKSVRNYIELFVEIIRQADQKKKIKSVSPEEDIRSSNAACLFDDVIANKINCSVFFLSLFIIRL